MTRKLTMLILFSSLTIDLLACHKGIAPEKPVRTTTTTTETPIDAPDKKMNEEILYYTNKFRASQGKPPLILDATCSGQAYIHSKDMAAGRVPFGHDGFEERVAKLTTVFGSIPDASENVAKGTLDAKAVVDGWIKSPGHRKNMLGNYDRIGIGVVHTKEYDGRMIYFTQVFIQHKEAPAKK